MVPFKTTSLSVSAGAAVGNNLSVIGNVAIGSTTISDLDKLLVDGTQGRLFTVTDVLTGTLFSVNNITGLPILEVQDTNTVIAGQYNTNAFVLSGIRTGLGTIPLGTNRLSVSGDSTFVGTISTSSHGTSENWDTAFNRTSQYQSLSSTFATNSTVSSVSSLLTPLTVTGTLTGQLLLTSVYQGVSGNWQNTFTNVQSNSGSYVLQGGNTLSQPLSVGTNDSQPLILETGGVARVTVGTTGTVSINTVGSGNNTLQVDNSGALGNGRLVIGAGGVHGQQLIIDPRGGGVCRISATGTDTNIAVQTGGVTRLTIGTSGGVTIADGNNIAVGTTTGTKIGTGTTQKIGFYGVTPVDQPALTADLLDSLQEIGLVASGSGDTPLNLSNGSLSAGNISGSTFVTPTEGDSSQWNSTYTTVQANSASWEESAEILPTVTNYLSTNNVLLSSATVSNTLAISSVQIRTRPTANIFIGDATTGRDAATGNHNFVFGVSAGNALTSGSNNVFLGQSASRNIGKFGPASNNFFAGYKAGMGTYDNVASPTENFVCHNFAVGFKAGYKLKAHTYQGGFGGDYSTATQHNIFIGYKAGYNSTTDSLYGAASNNNFLGNRAGYCNTTGCDNNFLGGSAGISNTTGRFNNFLGIRAGCANTTGNNNNFLGNRAGYFNTTGGCNNFFGNLAGRSNTTGNNNNFLGFYAGRNNTTGFNNNFLGYNAGRYNTTGGNNNFLGNGAGCTNTIGSNNTIIGNAANVATNSLSGVIVLGNNAIATQTNQIVLSTADISLRTLKGSAAGPNVFIGNSTTGRDAATGNHNFVFGLSAGNALTSGSSNVFVGACAGRVNTTGNFNNFLGNSAGCNNTTGSSNNILGNNAGRFNTTGFDNNFLGSSAGQNNTTGNFNNFLGRSAGLYNTTGYSNNFLGREAGRYNTTGGNNNFLGREAGWLNTTGYSNNFLGNVAGFVNTTGSYNNFLGYRAGGSNTTGGCNNFLGNRAGRFNTTGGNNNFLGNAAGCTNTVGSNNTIIGNLANVATNSLSGVIVLGNNAIATESHQVVLSTDNVIFRNTGDTFQIGSSAVPNNLTVFGSVSTTGSVFADSISKNIWVPAAAWIPRTTNGCGVDSRELSANKTNYDELLFDAGVNEFAQALVVMPSNYNNGTIAARFYWTCNLTGQSGGSNVIWVLAGRAFSDTDVLDAAMGTSQSILDTVLDGNYIDKLHISEPTASMTLAGTPAANRPVLFEISRNATSFGDSLSVDARLLGVEIIYTAA